MNVSEGVVVFSSDYCPFCIRAKSLLKSKNVDFHEIRVDQAPELRAEMARMAGARSVPQIWIHGEHVGGCDELMVLERTGRLDALLKV